MQRCFGGVIEVRLVAARLLIERANKSSERDL